MKIISITRDHLDKDMGWAWDQISYEMSNGDTSAVRVVPEMADFIMDAWERWNPGPEPKP